MDSESRDSLHGKNIDLLYRRFLIVFDCVIFMSVSELRTFSFFVFKVNSITKVFVVFRLS